MGNHMYNDLPPEETVLETVGGQSAREMDWR